jgi:homoserine dehydrogenase
MSDAPVRGAGPLRVALLGCGVVGSEVVRLLTSQRDDLAARIGRPIELAGVAVRKPSRPRDVPGLDPALLTGDADKLVRRDDVDLVVEVVGGIEPARRWLLTAMEHGKSVITANKALLAEDPATLLAAAAANGVDLYYEAAVAGAIPILRPLQESLVGDRVHRVLGIVNGTTNYILTRMSETGAGFAEALDEATAAGYAEADPSADVDGFDAAAKAAILASLAFHTQVTAADVHREGIAHVTAADVASAAAMGCVIKLLAIAERSPDGRGVAVRVHPAMIPRTHPLAAVRDAFNAVYVEAEAAGRLMFYGRGAGGAPTASAVLGDLVAAARHRVEGARRPQTPRYADLSVRPMSETPTRYHVCLDVADRPGVLASVAAVFADHGVSIEAVRQQQRPARDGATGSADGSVPGAELVVVTHTATDGALAATVENLRHLDVVDAVSSVMRVERE